MKCNHLSDNIKNDIAIIGMACLFPGAGNTEQFWAAIVDGKDCITEIPEQRLQEFRNMGVEPDINKLPRFGYLPSIHNFDPGLFNISGQEAALIDPCHRLMIMSVYRTLEDACLSREYVNGRRIGVFTSLNNSGYEKLIPPADYDMNAFLGNQAGSLPGNIAHVFGFRGAALSVDTLCSSALSAVHMACKNILAGECSEAVVAVGNVYALAMQDIINESAPSSTGKCRVFDAGADGFVGGEGVASLFIKPLDKALSDRNRIYAVIRNSECNNNGSRSQSLSSLDIDAQTELIRRCIEGADIDPGHFVYYEANGSSHLIGDAMEVKSLTTCFSEKTDSLQFCALGSIKNNMGHLNYSSGIAGLIKLILILSRKRIPPVINFEQANPYINFEKSPFYINTSVKEWPGGEFPKIGGINSFGVGGTNCTVILEEAPEINEMGKRFPSLKINKFLFFSAPDMERIKEHIKIFIDFIKDAEGEILDNIVYSRNITATLYHHRLALIFKDKNHLLTLMNEVLDENDPEAFNREWIYYHFSSQEDNLLKPVFLVSDFNEIQPPDRYLPYVDRNRTILPVHPGERNTRCEFVIFQYLLGKILLNMGLKPLSVIGTGTGKVLSRVFKNELSLEEALDLIADNAYEVSTVKVDKFKAAISEINKKTKPFWIEIGPRNSLGEMVDEFSREQAGHRVFPLYDCGTGLDPFSRLLAYILTRGIPVDIHSIIEGDKVPVPGLPFRLKPYHVHIKSQTVVQREVSGKESRAGREEESEKKAQRTSYIAPDSETGKKIALIIQECLDLEKVGIDDNFFDSGGDSESLMEITSKLNSEFRRDIPVYIFFQYPTIRQLEKYIQSEEREEIHPVGNQDEMDDTAERLDEAVSLLGENDLD